MHYLLTRIRTKVQRASKGIWPKTPVSRMISAQTLSNKDFVSLFNQKEVSAMLMHGEIQAAEEVLLSHYSHRVTDTWPTPPKTITDLRLNIDELSSEEIVTLANSILEYRFSPDGNLPKVTSEGKIDWRFNPISSPEWLWRLNRHQWWPVLGLAYAQTGDESFASAFVSQMLDWVKANPPPLQKDEKSPTWRLMEVGMRMRVSWIPTFALFYKSPVFNKEAKLTMLRSIYNHARFLFLFKTSQNHLIRESNGLAYISVYFPEFKEARLWLQVALTRLEQELTKQINQDGSHIEVSTGYQWLVVDEFEKTYDLLRSNGLSLPKENLSSWLEKMYNMLAYLVRPDGTFPEVNDGFIRWQYTRLANAGKMLGRNDFVYIGTKGKQGSLPSDTSVSFRDAGLYVMRSDWTNEARYLLFDAGPYGGYHGHEDKLSIELFAFGQPFIVDSGSYTYEETDPFRNYFVGSQGHNTVLVNGQSQIRRWEKDNLNPKPALENYATWISQADFDYVAATYGEGYSFFSLHKPREAEIINDVMHTRRILFIKPDYWMMIDELQATNPYSYQVLFHTPPELKVKVGSDNRVSIGNPPDNSCLYLVPADPHNIKVSCVTGSENPIQGWYSVEHHSKVPSTVVVYERKNSLSTVITTLLYPCRAGQTGDEVSIETIEVSGNKGLAFAVTTKRGRDYLMLSQSDGMKKFGPYKSKGIIVGIRTDKNGKIFNQFEWKA